MLELLQTVSGWLEVISYCVFGVVVVGTALAQKTPTKKDDEFFLDAEDVYSKIVKYFPIIGVNPRTKALEEELKRLKEQLKK